MCSLLAHEVNLHYLVAPCCCSCRLRPSETLLHSSFETMGCMCILLQLNCSLCAHRSLGIAEVIQLQPNNIPSISKGHVDCRRLLPPTSSRCRGGIRPLSRPQGHNNQGVLCPALQEGSSVMQCGCISGRKQGNSYNPWQPTSTRLNGWNNICSLLHSLSMLRKIVKL